ncbi:MAG TPA: hypothetical protein VGB82_20460 [Alphaproteobacteria bacterium]
MRLFEGSRAPPKTTDYDHPTVVDFLDTLMAVRGIQRSALSFIVTLEDYDIFVVCAYHYIAGKPLNLKCLLSYEIASSKTIQRRLDRLKRLHILRERIDNGDRRTKWLDLEERIVGRLEEVGSAYLEACGRSLRDANGNTPKLRRSEALGSGPST